MQHLGLCERSYLQMEQMRLPTVAVVLLLIGSFSANAQNNPYVVEGSIGKVEKQKAPPSGITTLEMEEWVGQQFILLPMPPSVQRYGYQSFEPSLDYSNWVGKILTATVVKRDRYPRVTFQGSDGAVVHATAYGGRIDGIALLSDLAYARQRWLGKSLWLRVAEIITFDASSNRFGEVRLGRTAHVTVKDVVAGWHGFKPVRFVLTSDDGREGFLDVQLSGTNVSDSLRGGSSLFREVFEEVNPRIRHKDWTARAWKAIGEGNVFVGMTAEQARWSWGSPKAVNRTIVRGVRSEQWVYTDHIYLYITNGLVSAMQN